MKKIAIFDLDGTLLNTLNSIAYCCNKALEDYNIDPLDISIYPNFIGHGADALVKGLADYVGITDDAFPEFKKHYLSIYNKNGSYNVAPYKNIPELLATLKDKGIKTAILSNKPQLITEQCCKIHFDGIFDEICGQKAGVPVKPDTTQLFAILNKFGFNTEDCIYCGDSDVDIMTGKNAKVLTLGAAWGFYGDKPFKDADGIIYDPLELLNYIKNKGLLN